MAEKLGNRAVVCYAAPAFHRVAELNAHTIRGTIIAHSTFPLVQRLAGHDSFYSCGPGDSGVANPEPERVEGVGLEDLLRSAGASGSSEPNETISSQLETLATDIESAIREEVPDTNPRKGLFFSRIREVARFADEFAEAGPSGRAFLRVSAFASSFNLDWYAVARN